MKTVVKDPRRNAQDAGRLAAAADAWSAAETAAERAASASTWADRARGNLDDVAEAVQAALRARLEAERASNARTRDDAWRAAAAAWAAADTAIDADTRVVAAMVDAVVRAA